MGPGVEKVNHTFLQIGGTKLVSSPETEAAPKGVSSLEKDG
jgi:hypothetical protein